PTGRPVQFWAYILLTVIALYWIVRGFRLLLSKTVRPMTANVSPGAMSVLALAGLAIALHTIVAAPLSPGSRDGIVGGVCLAETGKLPYGDAPGYDARSPLLYALHAPAVKVLPPSIDIHRLSADEPQPSAARKLSWANRESWLTDDQVA